MNILLVISAIIGICLILYRRDKKAERLNAQRYLLLMDVERKRDEEWNQELYDGQYEWNISIQAERWFMEWKNTYDPLAIHFGYDPRQGFIALCDPSLASLNIYGGATSKWENSDFRQLALDKFKELKDKYIECEKEAKDILQQNDSVYETPEQP